MEVRLLGPVEIEADGRAIPLRGVRQKALLARLALQPGQVVAADRLVDDLWGEQLPSNPLGALQVAVTRVRAALGNEGPLLVTRAPGYQLDVPPDAVDAVRFEQLVSSTRLTDQREIAAALRHALSLWRGAALADIGDAPFSTASRTRLEELRWSAFQRRVELDLQLGQTDGLVAELTAATAEQPLREGLWAALMMALFRTGRQGDALRTFQDARRILAEELGVEPGPELRRVERLVLDHDPALHAPAAATASGSPGPVDSSPMVGRDIELAALRDAWDAVARGGRALVLVTGEAGAGKTRLVTEWSREVASAGATVFTGRCDRDAVAPYQPVVQALHQWLAAVPPETAVAGLGPHATRLASLLPHLTGDGTTAVSPAGSSGDRYLLFEAVAAAIGLATPPGGLALVIDDLQWADRDTVLLLRHLLQHPRVDRVLIAATSRDSQAADGLPPDVVRRVEIQPLAEGDIKALLAATPGARPELAEVIAVRTSGNAFFVHQVMRHFADVDWNPSDADDLGLTDDVIQFVRRRLAGLPDAAQDMLVTGATMGSRFDAVALAAVAGVDEAEVVRTLAPAVEAGFLGEGQPAGRYAFAHVLVRDAIYRNLGTNRQALLHRHIAGVLESRPELAGRDLHATIAHHMLAAGTLGPPGRAAELARAAAAASVAALAFDDAATWLERALDAAGWLDGAQPGPSTGLSTEIRLDLARALSLAGSFEEAWEAAEATLASLPLATDAELRARVLAQVARHRWIGGDTRGGFAAHEEAFDLLAGTPRSRPKAQVLAALGQGLLVQSGYVRAATVLRDAIDTAVAVGAADLEGHALCSLGPILADLGDVEAGKAAIERALRIAQKSQAPDEVARCWLNLSSLLAGGGRAAEAVTAAETGLATTGNASGLLSTYRQGMAVNAGESLLRLGRWEEIQPMFEKAADPVGWHYAVSDALRSWVLGMLAVARGEWREASSHSEMALTTIAGRTDLQHCGGILTLAAEVAAQRGGVEKSARLANDAVVLVRGADSLRYGLPVLAAAIRLAADRGDRAAADDILSQARALVDRVVAAGGRPTGEFPAWLATINADHARAHGRSTPGEWAAVAESWEALGHPYWATMARCREVEALLSSRGEREHTSRLLARVREAADRLGARPLLDLAQSHRTD